MKKIFLVAAILTITSLVFGQKEISKPTVNETASEKAVKQVISDFTEGFAHNDAVKLNQILADEYFFSNPGGIILSRKQRLEELSSGNVRYDAFAIDDLNIHLYGKTALATLRTTVKGQNRGNDIAGNYRVILVFVKKKGKWQIVAQQATTIPK